MFVLLDVLLPQLTHVEEELRLELLLVLRELERVFVVVVLVLVALLLDERPFTPP